MAKSISLSFDMDTLFYNDGTKVSPLSLGGNGVNISSTNGVFTVEAAPHQSPGVDRVSKSKTNNQWTLEYNESSNQLFFIGVTDIVGTRSAEVTTFDLNSGGVNICLSGNDIVVSS
ncbi:MAG: hypothetical protein AAF985_13390 [Bacteroidota bacterium]